MIPSIIFVGYLVAYFSNRNCLPFILAFTVAEIIGRSSVFSWALYFNYGSIMFMTWSIVYCVALLYYRLVCEFNVKSIISCVIMIILQFYMSIDSANCKGSITFMYSIYYSFNALIHGCIILTLFQWRNIKRLLVNAADVFRLVMHYNGAIMGYRILNCI